MNAPVLVYTVQRFALFLAGALVLRLVGVRGPLLLVLAILVSGVASLLLLAGRRDQVAGVMASRIRRARRRLDDGAGSEDTTD